MPEIVQTNAPAKLNLALSVGPANSAGMHPIASWMITVDLCDALEVCRLPPGSMSRYAVLWHTDAPQRSEIDWPITTDLAVRAHLALERHVARPLPVQMKLEKRIPVAAGLGGGSSNAAAMLRTVNELYELDLPVEVLVELAAELGSDVPFLVRGGSAVVTGLGEQVQTHDAAPDLFVVLVLPEAACPTGRVYAAYDELGHSPIEQDRVLRRVAVAGELAPHDALSNDLFNDLAEPALQVAPELAALKREIESAADRPAAISGSGSCMFVVCENAVHAEALAESIERTCGVPTVAARTWHGQEVRLES